MSGVIRSVKKTFKKAGPLGKLAMIAGMIWLGGVAVNAFSGPGMGLSQAVTATNASWSSALGLSEATAPLVAEGAGTTAAAVAPTAELAATSAGAAEGAAAVNAGGMAGELTAMSANPLAADAAVNSTLINAGTEKVVETSLFGGNGGLIAGMMGGNAVMGAMSAAEAEEQRKQEEEARRSRGLFGVTYEGNNLNRQPTGIVRSQQVAQQATAAPTINSNYVQPQAMPQVNRPVARNDLAALRQQGLVASQKQQQV